MTKADYKNMDFNVDRFVEKLSAFGLKLTAESGGHFTTDNSLDGAEIKKASYSQYCIERSNGQKIMFLDGTFFLKTVQLTEDSLKVKLFV